VTAFLKSIGLAVVGAALFFCFFMMLSIPVLTVMAKLHDPNAPLEAPGVVVAPARLFRTAGVPLSAVAFAVCFVLAIRREHRANGRSGDRVN
jgi:multidrug efflux pump subunit AcrA (membrane-fusion protein)